MTPKDEQAYWEANFWEALETRDSHMDGVFFFAVTTTGVYCRPSCPSRRPRRENVIFFQRRDAAERAGFRACLRCKPDREPTRDAQSELVENICRYLEQHLDEAVTLDGLSRQLSASARSICSGPLRRPPGSPRALTPIFAAWNRSKEVCAKAAR